jgi:hypothetical protein
MSPQRLQIISGITTPGDLLSHPLEVQHLNCARSTMCRSSTSHVVKISDPPIRLPMLQSPHESRARVIWSLHERCCVARDRSLGYFVRVGMARTKCPSACILIVNISSHGRSHRLYQLTRVCWRVLPHIEIILNPGDTFCSS